MTINNNENRQFSNNERAWIVVFVRFYCSLYSNRWATHFLYTFWFSNIIKDIRTLINMISFLHTKNPKHSIFRRNVAEWIFKTCIYFIWNDGSCQILSLVIYITNETYSKIVLNVHGSSHALTTQLFALSDCVSSLRHSTDSINNNIYLHSI